MPGFRTHYFFGKENAKLQNAEQTRPCIAHYPKSYALGQQGPDVFFYDPLSHLLHPDNIGMRMHRSGARAFFAALFEERNNFKSKVSREICDAYIAGFIGHYTLDTAAHPYIHYRACKHKYKDRFYYAFGIHVLLETDLDAAILKHETSLVPSQFRAESTIAISRRERSVIGRLLSRTIAKVYPKHRMSAAHVKFSVWMMYLAWHFMQDEHGNRKRLMRHFDQLFFGSAVLSTIIAHDKTQTYTDPANTAHKPWKNPWSPKEESTEDFFMIMERAGKLYRERLGLYFEMVQKKRRPQRDKKHELLALLDDLSYDSGLPA